MGDCYAGYILQGCKTSRGSGSMLDEWEEEISTLPDRTRLSDTQDFDLLLSAYASKPPVWQTNGPGASWGKTGLFLCVLALGSIFLPLSMPIPFFSFMLGVISG